MRISTLSKSIFVTCALVLGSQICSAESKETSDRTYVPEDFARFAPLNARDMVDRIPGFRLDNSRSDDAARGLGQATENVLINGQRVNSKSATAAEALERIPASTVKRIEVLDGANLDIPGLSGLVANVVAEPSGISGTWSYRPSFRPNLSPKLNGGDISLSGQRGNLAWTLSFDSTPRGITGEGSEKLFGAASTLIETRAIEETSLFPVYGGSIGGRWTPPSGLIANLNVELENVRRTNSEVSQRFPANGEMERREVSRNDETDTIEIATDLEFDLGPGRLKLIGIHTDRQNPLTSSSLHADEFGSTLERQRFRQLSDEKESILRAEYNWAATGGTWDASIEAVLNELNSESLLFAATGNSPLSPVIISQPRVSVEENRNELFVTHSRDLGEDFAIQFSLGGEISELSSSGTNGQSRTFYRPKGSLILNWRADENTTINTRILREVGQLDFFDFVSQLDLDDGEDQTGNSDIVPQQSWRGEIEVERKLGRWGAGTATLFGEQLEDLVDQIPIGAGEGPGNIDRGRRYGITLEGTLNFDPIGFRGAQFTYSTTLQDSQIEDPLTGETRAINGEDQIDAEFEFRHDISGTNLAWGGEFSPGVTADQNRLNSVRTTRDLPGRYRTFIEHKNVWGLTARAEIIQPFGNVEKQTREIFSPDRNGTLIQTERSRIDENSVFILEISGTF